MDWVCQFNSVTFWTVSQFIEHSIFASWICSVSCRLIIRNCVFLYWGNSVKYDYINITFYSVLPQQLSVICLIISIGLCILLSFFMIMNSSMLDHHRKLWCTEWSFCLYMGLLKYSSTIPHVGFQYRTCFGRTLIL